MPYTLEDLEELISEQRLKIVQPLTKDQKKNRYNSFYLSVFNSKFVQLVKYIILNHKKKLLCYEKDHNRANLSPKSTNSKTLILQL